MFHRLPTTDDDSDALRTLADTLTGEFSRFFDALHALSVTEEPNLLNTYRLIAHVFHDRLLQTVKRASLLPGEIFISRTTGKPSKRVSTILSKLHYLMEEGGAMTVDESALSWRDPVERLTAELKSELELCDIVFQGKSKMLRAVSTPTSMHFWLMCFGAAAATVALIAVSVIASTRAIDEYVSLVISVLCALVLAPCIFSIIYISTYMVSQLQYLEEESQKQAAGSQRSVGASISQIVVVNGGGAADHPATNVLLPPSLQAHVPTNGNSTSLAESDNSNSGVGDVNGLMASQPPPQKGGNTGAPIPGDQQQQQLGVPPSKGRRESAADPQNQSATPASILLNDVTNPKTNKRGGQHSGSNSGTRDGTNVILNSGKHVVVTSPLDSNRKPRPPASESSNKSGAGSTPSASSAASSSLTEKMGGESKMQVLFNKKNANLASKHVAQAVVMIGYDAATLNVMLWNSAAEAATGFLSRDVVGRPIEDMLFIGFSGSDLLRKRMKKARAEKFIQPFNVQFSALATPSFTLLCRDVPVFDNEGQNVGRLLICTMEKDSLKEHRNYTLAFRSVAVKQHFIKRAGKDSISAKILADFANNSDLQHLNMYANKMNNGWDWMSPNQLLSKALAPYMTKCKTDVAADIAAYLRIDTNVGDVISGFVGAVPEGPRVTVKVRTETLGKVNIMRVVIGNKQSVEFKNLDFWTSRCVEMGGFVSLNSAHCEATLLFPCQVTQFGFADDDAASQQPEDPIGNSATNEFAESMSAQPVVSSQVSVWTLVMDPVLKHNISMVLLKTSYVAVTAMVSFKEFSKAAEALRPADAVVVDISFYDDAVEALSSYPEFATPILIVVGAGSPPEGCQEDHFIKTPISRELVDAMFLKIGQTVDKKKKEEKEAADRERILQSRQDSPWTQGKLLGRGAFGAVYEAVSDLTGGKMAVKMFYFNQNEDIDTLLNEIQIMCQLSHPHVVHYFYCERKENNSINLFMELCDSSLHDILSKRTKRLSVPFVIRQIVSAVNYLHEQNIVHRDLKPQNILLKGDSIKLTDFGTARKVSHKDLHDVQGTFRFMAPEVYQGTSHDISCDIWSIGCLVCELENQIPDFMLPRNSMMLAEMTEVNLPRGLRGNALDFVESCLALDPKKRPSASMLLLHPYLNERQEKLFDSDRRYSSVPVRRDSYAESIFSLDSDDGAPKSVVASSVPDGDDGDDAAALRAAGVDEHGDPVETLFTIL